MTATTAIKNATHTMMPRSVKNDRSLWLHTVCRAWRIASVNGMAGKLIPLHSSPASYRLFISQGFHWVQPRGSTRGIEPEQDARQGRDDQRHDDRCERHMRRNGRCE